MRVQPQYCIDLNGNSSSVLAADCDFAGSKSHLGNIFLFRVSLSIMTHEGWLGSG